jgi:hypothetical protein
MGIYLVKSDQAPSAIPVEPIYESSGQYNQFVSYYKKAIIVGIILIMIGGILFNILGLIDTPNRSEYTDDEHEIFERDQEHYFDNMRMYSAIGKLIMLFGVIILSLGLIIGAIKDHNLPENVRLGMLIAMSIIISLRFVTLFAG